MSGLEQAAWIVLGWLLAQAAFCLGWTLRERLTRATTSSTTAEQPWPLPDKDLAEVSIAGLPPRRYLRTTITSTAPTQTLTFGEPGEEDL